MALDLPDPLYLLLLKFQMVKPAPRSCCSVVCISKHQLIRVGQEGSPSSNLLNYGFPRIPPFCNPEVDQTVQMKNVALYKTLFGPFLVCLYCSLAEAH